jgi:hypothetical protein
MFGWSSQPNPSVGEQITSGEPSLFDTIQISSGKILAAAQNGLFKKEPVDETPFEEPCRKELEKWGRFTLAPDIKGADLVIRAYEKGQTNYVPVMSPGVTGSVNVGQSFFILDVWQPSSKKVIWSTSKNVGTSWSTNTGIANLCKKAARIYGGAGKIGPKIGRGLKDRLCKSAELVLPTPRMPTDRLIPFVPQPIVPAPCYRA